VVLSHDGCLALSASTDHTLRLWDVKAGTLLQLLRGHEQTIYAAALTPDGRRAVSASGDHTLIVWDLESGQPLASFQGDAAFVAVAMADDRTFAVGTASGAVHVLKLQGDAGWHPHAVPSLTVPVGTHRRGASVVPPKSLAVARGVCPGGALSVPALAWQHRPANVNAACVRALAQMGGEPALAALEEYALKDGRRTVSRALLEAFRHFEAEEYGRRVVAQLRGVGTIVRPGEDRALMLRHLTTPFALRLRGRGTTHLRLLAGATFATSLDLYGCERLEDLSPLATLTRLQALDMPFCPRVKDLTPLAGLASLKRLNLQSCTGLTRLDGLEGLANLTTLSLMNCTRITDLAPLAGLSRLETLDLTRCTALTDLTPLVGLAGLRRLRLTDLHLAVPPEVNERARVER
jgi:hypothetical protein